jgi:hypothetical protein
MAFRRCVLSLALLASARPPAFAQDVDSVLARIERLVVSGDRAAARVITDSLLAAAPSESPRIPDVLYWRAATASNAADAERDYLRITVEHPLASRAVDALLALGQLELARGDKAAARRRFDRLLRDYPSGRHVARASLWSGQLAIEERDFAAGCSTLTAARPQVGSAEIELANRYDYFIGQCARLTVQDTSTTPAVATPPVPTGPQYSVQVAAYTARRDATALANRLKARGFDVRVAEIRGARTPYRVRIGRYATRAEAASAAGRIRAARLAALVVEAEPR